MESVPVSSVGEDSFRPVEVLWRVCKRGRWWMLLTALATVVATVIGLSFVPRQYKSVARILVVEQLIPQRMVAPLSDASTAQTLLAISQEVLSRPRLIEIIHELGLFPEESSPDAAVERMRKSFLIEPVDLTRDGAMNAFDISFTASTPQAAQAVTRRLASLFIERRLENQTERADTTSSFLDDQLAQKRKNASELEQQIRNFKMQYSAELPDAAILNPSGGTEAEIQLQNTVASLNRARQGRAALESSLRLNLNARLTRLEEERADMATRFTPKHPLVIKNAKEIADIEGVLAAVQAETQPAENLVIAVAAMEPGIVQLVGQLQTSQLEIDNLAKSQRQLEASVSEYRHRMALMPAREQQLAQLERDLTIVNQEIDGLVRMQTQSGMAAEMDRRQEGQQFRQLDAATLPAVPSSPKRMLISLAALGGGLALGFVIAFLLDLMNPSYHAERDLKERFAPPIVLSIPPLPTPAEKRKRKWTTGFEWVAGTAVMFMLAVVELYVLQHP